MDAGFDSGDMPLFDRSSSQQSIQRLYDHTGDGVAMFIPISFHPFDHSTGEIDDDWFGIV
jgi:hypothetical protein